MVAIREPKPQGFRSYYDPETGRFISPDDITYLDPDSVNGLNLYAYCGNNPVNCVDPTGNAPWWSWLISGLQLIGGIALCFVPGAQGIGAGLILGGTLGLIANAALPAIAQIIGGHLQLPMVGVLFRRVFQ